MWNRFSLSPLGKATPSPENPLPYGERERVRGWGRGKASNFCIDKEVLFL